MTWARLHALINQETGSALLYFWIPKATEEDLTVCNGGGMVFQHTRLTCQIHVQSPTLCQTWCNKKQMHAWCFRHLQACPQCRAPWAVSFKPPCGQQKQPRCQKRAWVVAGKVHGCEPVLTNFVPPPSSASSGKCRPPPSAAMRTPGWGRHPGTEVAAHRRRVCAWAEQSYVSQADIAGEAIPSLCYLLVFRRNQNKLWCLMTSSLLCAKHLKRSTVPQNITWVTGL